MEQLILIIIGWVLGSINPLVAERIKRPFRRRELMASMKVELEERCADMARMAYVLRRKCCGVLDMDFIEWLKEILSRSLLSGC